MRAYFAVGWTLALARDLLAGHRALVSYALVASGKVKPQHMADLAAVCTGLVFDSGAFTAWRQGTAVDPEAYWAFLRSCPVPWEWAIALDVIGDAEGTRVGWRDVPNDLRPKIVPVFHEGDPWSLLAEYDPPSRLVGLGRIEGRSSRKATLVWYDEVFNRHPDGRFRALGNTSPETLEPYPFVSFDATTWERDAAYSHRYGWPYNRCDRRTRMRAYIEACETIAHRPSAQGRLRLTTEAA